MDWDKWLLPALYFIGSLLVQAALGGWFFRGIKGDRDALAKDIASNRKAFDEHVAAAVAVFAELREQHSDIQTALGIQGAEMTNLRSDYAQMTDLVMVKMPAVISESATRAERVVAAAIERAEERYVKRLSLAARRGYRSR